MKKTFLFLSIILFFNQSQAQLGFGKIEDIKTIKEVPLLIILKTPNEENIKKLKRKGEAELNEYYDEIESYNKNIQEGFKDSWTFSNDIRFIGGDELKNYATKSNERKYAYIRTVLINGSIQYWISLVGKKKPVYSFLYQDLPNSADFKYISQQIQNYLILRINLKTGKKSKKELKKELESKAQILKTKTLLLDKNDLTKKLISQIKKVYKYQFKLTTKEEIDDAILNNSDVAYLKISPLYPATSTTKTQDFNVKEVKLIYIQYIIDASNGEILAFVQPSGLTIGKATNKGSNEIMTIKKLKTIIKSIER
nr:hypothetical protein [uncultured Psychroserpens sp.]